MTNILSEEQVSIIRNIVKNAGANYYDIEVELTDHICNMVEQLMLRNENIAFEEALNQALHVFEPEGLSNLIQKRIKLNKNISPESLLFTAIKKAFKLPHLILTLAVGYSYYLIYQIYQGDLITLKNILKAIYYIIIISIYVIGFITKRSLKNQIRKISTLNNYSINGRLGVVVIICIIYPFFLKYDTYTALQYSLYAGLQCLAILYIIGIVYNDHLQIKKAKKQFPYAFK